eukprot:CAMPEP_0176058638 /NCGR_PEP_ID=MMETSP0120_2-20121206/29217_1 /TAXON_ID=160619 /ORGANISM="Kryptoperidinium foliaceum, Strain CCMP 1326" /LENGTH=193 /DNA_ID=CAMNT_0017392167 /DNA_START=39 /DNA_END=617 /DNA_ORIENTATION=+
MRLALHTCHACAQPIGDGMPAYMRCDRMYCSQGCRREGYMKQIAEQDAAVSIKAPSPPAPPQHVGGPLRRRRSSDMLGVHGSPETSPSSSEGETLASTPSPCFVGTPIVTCMWFWNGTAYFHVLTTTSRSDSFWAVAASAQLGVHAGRDPPLSISSCAVEGPGMFPYVGGSGHRSPVIGVPPALFHEEALAAE